MSFFSKMDAAEDNHIKLFQIYSLIYHSYYFYINSYLCVCLEVEVKLPWRTNETNRRRLKGQKGELSMNICMRTSLSSSIASVKTMCEWIRM